MAISFSPGQVVASGDWDALFTQHGGMPQNQQSILRPPTEKEIQAAAQGGDDDPGFNQRPIYRYTLTDGSIVEARTARNGTDWEVVDYKPSAKFQETQKPATATTAGQKPAGSTTQVEGTPDPSKPGGFDNERPVMVTRGPDGTLISSEPLTPAEKQQWDKDRQASRNPGGKTDEQLAAEKKEADAKAERAAAANKPGAPTLKPDGQGGTIAVQTMPDGSIKTTPLPGVPSEASSKYKEVKQDPNTGKWHGLTAAGAWEEIQGGPSTPASKDAFGVEPEGAPEMTYTVGQMSSGLRTYSQWLSQQVKLHKDTNGAQGVAPAEATKLMERRIALAESALKEQEGLGNVQASQRGQDITQRGQTLQETASRRGTAERIGTSTLSTFVPLAQRLGPGGGALLSKAINDTLAASRGYVDSFGGLRESPEISADSFPALADLRRASMAGIQTAAQGGPRIFDARSVAAPPDPTAAAGAMAPPVFRPMPEVPATAPAAPTVPPAVNPIDQSPIVLPTQLPGAAPSGPPVRDDHRLDPGLTPMMPFVPPEQYQPAQPVNMDPSQGPVGRIQMDPEQMAASGAWQSPMQLDPARYGHTPDNPMVTPGMPSRFMQETRYGAGNFFDPDLAGNDLSLRLGIDPEIMRQAISGLYG